jgi:hypothetical protein
MIASCRLMVLNVEKNTIEGELSKLNDGKSSKTMVARKAKEQLESRAEDVAREISKLKMILKDKPS